MKVVLLLGDGMADEPITELGGMTPLEFAETPHMDRVAREGMTGLVSTVPDGYDAGSDVANLGLLGYDAVEFYTGRGPLEAASMGIDLGPGEVAYRCNLVTISDGLMADFSAGHISSEEGASLLSSLQAAVSGVRFHPGISYRNLLTVPGGAGGAGTPPHDIVGEPIGPSDPLTVEQGRIDAFADATGDHQWIHVDPQRAAHGPFGTTIAHGYLTLSLLVHMVEGLDLFPPGVTVINYGIDKLRYPSPVPSGSSLVLDATITNVEPKGEGRTLMTLACRVSIPGAQAPALVADVLYLFVDA